MMRPQNRDKEIHVSDLTICPYRVVRDKLTDVYIPMKTAAKMAQGKLLDELTERYVRRDGEGVILQPKFVREIVGVPLHLTPDLIDLVKGTIEDYKRPGSRLRSVPEHYEFQLNAYRWGTQGQVPATIKKLILNVLAPNETQVFVVKKWNDLTIENEVHSRLNALHEVMADAASGTVDLTCGDPTCMFCRPAKMIRLGEDYGFIED